MLLFADGSLFAAKFCQLAAQFLVALRVVPNQFNTTLDGTVFVKVLRIIGSATAVYFPAQPSYLLLNIVALRGQLVDTHNMLATNRHRSRSKVDTYIALTQCAAFLRFLSLDGHLHIILVLATHQSTYHLYHFYAFDSTFQRPHLIVSVFRIVQHL